MGLLDDFGDNKIKEEKQLISKKDKSLEDKVNLITNIYERWLSNHDRPWNVKHNYEKALRYLRNKSLKSMHIEEFIIRLNQFTKKESFKYTGPFISALIKRSHLNGHNDFKINIDGSLKSIESMGDLLIGEKNNPINITFKGESIINSSESTTYCNLIFNCETHVCGKVSNASNIVFNETTGHHCGNYAYESVLRFKDNVDSLCAQSCRKSTIIFEKDVNDRCAELQDGSDIYTYGKMGEGFGGLSKNTKFYSPYIENLEIIFNGKFHRIQEIQPPFTFIIFTQKR